MNNASTAGGRGQDKPNDPEPFFPTEGTFNPVVPLSEVGRGPAPLSSANTADVGKPAEAAWARESRRAGWKKEDEETLVPARRARGTAARGARPSWVFPAVVIAMSVVAGLASGSYLIRSSQRAPRAQQPAAPVAAVEPAAEAPTLPPAPAPTPAPAAEEVKVNAKVEKKNDGGEDDKTRDVAKVEKSREAARPSPTPRAEPPARAAAEARVAAPAPKPARTQSAQTPRPRVTAAERRTPARSLPVSSPPPSAKSSKVIQWP